MNIDWSHFTPWTSLAGGVLVGTAAALFILFSGRLLGVSGILGGLLTPRRGDTAWRLVFLVGMLCAPAMWSLFATLEPPRVDASGTVLMVAGLLVGWGTRHGSGCTSGHGVCGLSRLSPRSLAATLAFMLAGVATVYLVRHVLGGVA